MRNASRMLWVRKEKSRINCRFFTIGPAQLPGLHGRAFVGLENEVNVY